MYVFDTNSLIHAYRDDFPPDKYSDFWIWFDNVAKNDGVIIPEMVYEEINKKSDGLGDFLKQLKNVQSDPTTNCLSALPEVLNAYGTLSDVDLERLEHIADPYVISHAKVLAATAVTCEVSSPLKIGINKKIPDICQSLNVDVESYAHFLWRMRGCYP